MALFNLTDISYRKEGSRKFDSLSTSLSNYQTNLLRFPIDVGNTDKAHYMMIHINVQEKTAYQSTFANDKPTIHKNRVGLRNQTGATNVGGNAALLVDNVQKIGQAAGGVLAGAADKVGEMAGGKVGEIAKNISQTVQEKATSGLNAITSEGFRNTVSGAASGFASNFKNQLGTLNDTTFLRKIRRTTDSIALYMPSTMAYTHQQQYNTLQMGGENAAFYGAGLSLINDAMAGKVNPEQLGRNLTPFIAEKLSKGLSGALGQNSTSAIFASLIGGVQNPQLELIYGSPSFRTFRFEFMFYPTSEAEALQVQQMIERLKFHQAPEIMTGTAGYFLVPPSEFDIEFYYNGQINPNIPKISTCVLTTIDMDYAPKGWQAYEVPGSNEPKLGGTGMPFGIRLNLEFQETEIMTKYNFQGDRKFISELNPAENKKTN